MFILRDYAMPADVVHSVMEEHLISAAIETPGVDGEP